MLNHHTMIAGFKHASHSSPIRAKVIYEHMKMLFYVLYKFYSTITYDDLFTDLKEFDPDFFHDKCRDLQTELHSYIRSKLLGIMVSSTKSFIISLHLFLVLLLLEIKMGYYAIYIFRYHFFIF